MFTGLLIASLLCGCSVSFEARLGQSAKSEQSVTTKQSDSKQSEKDGKEDDKSKGKTIEEVVKGDTRVEGLFTLFQNTTNGSAHLLVKRDQLDKEYIYFTHTTDGVVAAGHFRGNFRDNRVFSIRKHFNRIELVSENTAFYFAPSNALSRAASANISPSLLSSQEIVAEDEEKGQYLIKADDIFLTETLHPVKPVPREGQDRGFNLGKLSKDKTKYLELRSYPNNTDIQVEYVYENETPRERGGDEVTDPRNVSIRMQHTILEMPADSYQPRFDDPRVGYFTHQITDLTSPSATPYRDVIHRWKLEKKDKDAALSEPVEPITWWIENTTPVELRDTIRDAALTWNKAFEAAGFMNALVVKVQPDDADWNAGDIRYNVLRWTSSPNPPFGGYGPSFVNPRTGQILGADIMLEYVFLANRIRLEQVFPEAGLFGNESVPESADPHLCSLGRCLQQSTLFGVNALKARGMGEVEVTRLIKESLYYLILHELGHTLGLNHNMRASQMLLPEELNNRKLTEEKGLIGSVMDYPAIHLNADGAAPVFYYTTTPGPYDKWAIEFGYSQAIEDPAGERERLNGLLARSTEPELAFGNDADDMRAPGKAIDPRVMINDLSGDAITYSADRLGLVGETTRRLKDRMTEPGNSYHALRTAYLTLTAELANAANAVSRYIGGVYVDRAFIGQEGATEPFRPVPLEDQKRALKTLREEVFAPAAFDAPTDLYNYLQMQRRGFNFSGTTEDPKIHERALNIQSRVLDHLLHVNVLARLTDTRLYGNEYPVADFLEDLTGAVFEDDLESDVNTFRQNLQLEYVNRMIRIVGKEGQSNYDHPARSAALHQLRQLEAQLKELSSGNAETVAHRQNVLFTIAKALETD